MSYGGGYPPNQPAYPPGGAYPPQPGQGGYPPTGYPPQNPGQYPPSAYPPTNAPYPGYPPTNQTQPPYPGAGGYMPPGPPQQYGQYPGAAPGGYPQAQPGYPPGATQHPGYPGQQAPQGYPGQYPPQNANPYPQVGGGAPPSQYPGYGGGENVPPPAQMASCFNEMKSHVGNIQAGPIAGRPTIRPAAPFDAVNDANALRKAMKGFGTDDKGLISVLCHRTSDQRQKISQEFKQCFGRDIIQDVKSETSGNFEELLVALLQPPVEYYVSQLREAMNGVGTDEDVLIEIFCTLSNAEINTIKRAYEYKYHMRLEQSIQSETSGYFQRLLTSLCNGGRDESMQTNPATAAQDAQSLYQAGEGRMGTDEETFNLVLCRRNFAQLKLVCQEYEKQTGRSLEKAIKSEFSGDVEDGLVAVVRCCNNRADFFASRLHKAMSGFGTNDTQLIRILVTRCDIDLEDIKQAFEAKYGKSLKSWIKGEASGSYEKALLALINEA